MSALPARYQDNNGYVVAWFRLPCGKLQSYRWAAEKAEEMRSHVPHGAVEVQDPFRIGAPVGGYADNAAVGDCPLPPIKLKTDRRMA